MPDTELDDWSALLAAPKPADEATQWASILAAPPSQPHTPEEQAAFDRSGAEAAGNPYSDSYQPAQASAHPPRVTPGSMFAPEVTNADLAKTRAIAGPATRKDLLSRQWQEQNAAATAQYEQDKARELPLAVQFGSRAMGAMEEGVRTTAKEWHDLLYHQGRPDIQIGDRPAQAAYEPSYPITGGPKGAEIIRKAGSGVDPVTGFVADLAGIPPSLASPSAIVAMLITHAPTSEMVGTFGGPMVKAVESKFGPQVAAAVQAEIGSAAHLGAFGGAQAAVQGKGGEEIAAATGQGALSGLAFGLPGAVRGVREAGALSRVEQQRQARGGEVSSPGAGGSPQSPDAVPPKPASPPAPPGQSERLYQIAQDAENALREGRDPTPVPESPDTIAAQIDGLNSGKRPAVLVTPGAAMPNVPEGFETLKTDAGTFIFDRSKVAPAKIRQAVKNRTIGDVLGYGIPDKPAPEATIGTVVVRTPEGVERQAVVTDEANLPRVHEAAQALAEPGDTITLEDGQKVIADRVEAGAKTQAEARTLAEQLKIGEFVPDRTKSNRAARAPEPRPDEPAPAREGVPDAVQQEGRQEKGRPQGLLKEPAAPSSGAGTTPGGAETAPGGSLTLPKNPSVDSVASAIVKQMNDRGWSAKKSVSGSGSTYIAIEHPNGDVTRVRVADHANLTKDPEMITRGRGETPDANLVVRGDGKVSGWDDFASGWEPITAKAWTDTFGETPPREWLDHHRRAYEGAMARESKTPPRSSVVHPEGDPSRSGVARATARDVAASVIDRPEGRPTAGRSRAEGAGGVKSPPKPSQPNPSPQPLNEPRAVDQPPAPLKPVDQKAEQPGERGVVATHGPKPTKPGPFSRSDLERRIVAEYQRSPRAESAKMQEDADLAQSGQVNEGDFGGFFKFRSDKLPADLLAATDGRPDLRRAFKTGVRDREAIGSDQLAALGADRYVQIAERKLRVKNEDALAEAKRGLRRDAEQNPQGAFLAQLHDNLPSGRQTAKTAVDPATLKRGATFKINGHEFRVTQEGDGYRMLRDGEDFDPVPLEALETVPVDKGSLAKPGKAETVASKADAVADAAATRIKGRANKPGRSGGGTTLFDDVVDAAIYVAALATSRGIRGGKMLTGLVKSSIADVAPHLKDAADRVRRIAKGIIDDSRQGSGFATDRFERAVADAQASKSREGRGAARAKLREALAKIKANPDADAKALTADLRKTERATLKAYREGIKDAAAQGRREVAGLIETLKQADTRREVMNRFETRGTVDKTRDSLKQAQATIDGVRRQARALIEDTVPKRLRGAFLSDLDNAKTSGALQRTMAKIVRVLAEDSAKSDTRIAARLAGGRTQKLSLARRDAVRQINRWIEAEQDNLRSGPKWEDAQRMSAAADRIRQWREVMEKAYEDQRAETMKNAKGFALRAQNRRKQIVERVEKRDDLSKPGQPADREASRALRYVRAAGNMDTLSQLLDNQWDRRGPVARIIRKGYSAKDRALSRYFGYFDSVDKIVREHGYQSVGDWYAKWTGSLGRASAEILDSEIGGYKPTKGEAASVHAADPETRARLSDGARMTYENAKREEPFRVTNAERDRIENAFGPDDHAIIKKLKDLVGQDYEEAHAVTLRLLGFAPDKVKEYNPISVNRVQSRDAHLPPGYRAAIHHAERAGFMKSRIENGATMVLRSFPDVVLQHLHSKAHLIETAEYVRDVEAALAHEDVMKPVVRKFGRELHDNILNSLQEYAGVRQPVMSALGQWVSNRTGDVAGAMTQLNWKTYLRQVAGIARLRTEMGTARWARGIAGMFGEGIGDVIHETPRFRERYQSAPYHQFTTTEEGAGALTPAQFTGGLKAAGRSLAAGRLGDVTKGTSAAIQALKLGNFFDSLPARVAIAGFGKDNPRAAVDAFWRTQNTGGAFDSSQYRVKGRHDPLSRAWQMFTSDSDKQYNMMYQAWKRATVNGDWGHFAGVTTDVAVNVLLSAAVTYAGGRAAYSLGSALAGRNVPDGVKQHAMDTAKSRAVQDAASSIFPGAGRFASLIQNMMNKRGPDSVDTAPQDVTKQVIGAVQEALLAATTEPKHPNRKTISDADHYKRAGLKLMRALGELYGNPLEPVVGDVQKAISGYRGD